MTLPLTAAQSSALSALCAGLAGTRLVLIGAAALGYHVPLSRLTADVDLALVVDPARFDALLGPLGWRRDVRVRQRWYGPDDVVADILPASADVLRAGVVRFDDDTREMSVLGFDLALAHASAVSLEGSAVTVDVASLPALVVLKIVSWLDRPSDRAKDLSDLARVLEHALGDDDERRWDPEQPVYASGLEHEDQGAFFVGHAPWGSRLFGAYERDRDAAIANHFTRGLSTTSATPARITAIAPTAVHPMRSLPSVTPRSTATTGFTNA